MSRNAWIAFVQPNRPNRPSQQTKQFVRPFVACLLRSHWRLTSSSSSSSNDGENNKNLFPIRAPHLNWSYFYSSKVQTQRYRFGRMENWKNEMTARCLCVSLCRFVPKMPTHQLCCECNSHVLRLSVYSYPPLSTFQPPPSVGDPSDQWKWFCSVSLIISAILYVAHSDTPNRNRNRTKPSIWWIAFDCGKSINVPDTTVYTLISCKWPPILIK